MMHPSKRCSRRQFIGATFSAGALLVIFTVLCLAGESLLPVSADGRLQRDYHDSVPPPHVNAYRRRRTPHHPIHWHADIAQAPMTHSAPCRFDRQSAKRWDIADPSVAYLFLAHSEETVSGMFETLEELWHPSDVFVIHVDTKVTSDNAMHKLQAINGTCSNIHFTDKRVDVVWGESSIVEAEMALVTKASQLDHPWTYAFLLDGSAIPTTTRQVRRDWLRSHPPNSNGVLFEALQATCSWREEDWRPYCYRTPARCLNEECSAMSGTPGNAPIYRGSQWVWFSRQFVDYLSNDPSTAAWMDFFRSTMVADESFFQSVLYASPYRSTSVISSHIYTDWQDECRSHVNKHPHNSPCYLGEADIGAVMASGALFARKFYAQEPARAMIRQSLAILEHIENAQVHGDD